MRRLICTTGLLCIILVLMVTGKQEFGSAQATEDELENSELQAQPNLQQSSIAARAHALVSELDTGDPSVRRFLMGSSIADHEATPLNIREGDSNTMQERMKNAYLYAAPQQGKRSPTLDGAPKAIIVGEPESLNRLFARFRQMSMAMNNNDHRTFREQWDKKSDLKPFGSREDKDYTFVGADALRMGPTESASDSIGQVLENLSLRDLNSVPDTGVRRSNGLSLDGEMSRRFKSRHNRYRSNYNDSPRGGYFSNAEPSERRMKRIRCKMPISAGVKNPANCEIDSYLNANGYDDLGNSLDMVGR